MHVHEYIAQALAQSGRSHADIARDCGWPNSNILSMIKRGPSTARQTKMPIEKVAPFAKATGTDPWELMRLVLREYQPDAWGLIQAHVADHA